MFCRNCGSELKEGAKFCTKCGTKIEETAAVNNVVDNTADTVIINTEEDLAYVSLNKEKTVKADKIDDVPKNKKDKKNNKISSEGINRKNKGSKVLTIVLIVILVIAIVVGGLFAFILIKPDAFDFVKENSFVSGLVGDDNDDYDDLDDEDDEDEDDDDDKNRDRVRRRFNLGGSAEPAAPAEEAAPAVEAVEEAYERPNSYDFDDVFLEDFDLYEEPFEQEHFEYWDLDIDNEVNNVILPQVSEYEKNLGRYKKTTLAGGDIVAYTIDGTPVKVVVSAGYNGWNVERIYYGVADFYTILNKDYDQAELYYSDGRLCRAVDSWGNYYDYDCYEWEEINDLGLVAARDRADVYAFVKSNVK